MNGAGASPGIAIGRAFVVPKSVSDIYKKNISDISKEVIRFNASIEASILQLDSLVQGLGDKGETSSVEILEAHKTMLRDIEFVSAITNAIEAEGINAEYAVQMAVKNLADIFSSMEDEYLKERAVDIMDVGSRIINNLTGKSFEFSIMPAGSVVIAKDLLPSDTAQIDKANLEGFATEVGGKTSHTAIIARTLGIPAVLGVPGITSLVCNGDMVIVDGIDGEVVLDPDQNTLDLYMVKKRQYASYREKLMKLRDLPTITVDGIKVELEANIGCPDDVDAVLLNGAQGIGLFRTEFLYMNRDDFPSEDMQFEAYRKVVSEMGGKKVTIRTLDIGGDKALPYFGLENEENPFLGYRAIRVCLDMREMFKAQLRAILRASVFGKACIMYPMITDGSEVIEANRILEEVKDELNQKGIPFSDAIEVGIMIETPAAAMEADILAQHVDFFSIGTNDLTQYALAVDRGNPRVRNYYNYFNTGVLRLIKNCIDQAHIHGKYVAMCGEMASDPDALKLLLGLGLDVFSMSPASIPVIKDIIMNTSMGEAVKIAKEVLELKD